jgi:hypothetical protein
VVCCPPAAARAKSCLGTQHDILRKQIVSDAMEGGERPGPLRWLYFLFKPCKMFKIGVRPVGVTKGVRHALHFVAVDVDVEIA